MPPRPRKPRGEARAKKFRDRKAEWKHRFRSPVFKRVYALACKKQKRSQGAMAEYLGYGASLKDRGKQMVRDGEKIRFDRWLYICRMAGIPESRAVTIWAREHIPPAYEHMKKWVGCTAKMPRRRRCSVPARKRMDQLTPEELERSAETRTWLQEITPNAGPISENPLSM
jgi:hypothetical protein